MNPWSNIVVSSRDSEIRKIDALENTLGRLSPDVRKIRELITRFEACHFKYKKHLKNIIDSIISLHPTIDPAHIGTHHIHKGVNAWMDDTTGRSRLGQQYLHSLETWLGKVPHNNSLHNDNKKFDLKVSHWLGEKTSQKQRLVRLLIARLTWDWVSLKELQKGDELEQLELQICSMDICHYAFPDNLTHLLQGLGQMNPDKHFRGCGIYSPDIRSYCRTEFSKLCTMLRSRILSYSRKQDKRELLRIWLIACLLKTVKEQIGIKKSVLIPID